MNINIIPITQYNAFVDEPNGNYLADACIGHTGFTLAYNFEEKEMDAVIQRMRELLQYFKGENTITVRKLVKVKPYKHRSLMRKDDGEMRDWEVKFSTTIKVPVVNPKIAKVVATSGKSLSGSGWFLEAKFGIEGVSDFGFGVICSSYKSAKEVWESRKSDDEEIAHWVFEEVRKSRKVKCNICKKQIINLTAQQCSECGRYFCNECMTSSACPDCENKGDD